ncbi:unnamed protein product [Prorocentrum cordatum]|uniref:Uncharacterized protein n=1 Tax=Prorocentrum cordatum TaxID=2364126 RepID=A0ABN9Q113_9DINO|nr:unnamed protein product [Polarella glacialis]
MIPRLALRTWLGRFNHEDLLPHMTMTDHVYTGCFLATLNPTLCGRVLEAAAKEHDRLSHPCCKIRDAARNSERGSSPKYDWLRVIQNCAATRVEHKSGRVRWNGRWLAHFQNIKPWCHDELRLSFWTPATVYSFVHSGDKFCSSAGQRTDAFGHSVLLTGPKGETYLDAAVQRIVLKANTIGQVTSYGLGDPIVRSAFADLATFTHKVYSEQECPLHALSRAVRARLLESIARRFDMIRHPDCIVEDADCCAGVNGISLGENQRPYDWKRVSLTGRRATRVECKTAQVAWDCTNHTWRASWHGIKEGTHDELQLTVYSPWALRTFIHDGTTGFARCGVQTSVGGSRIVIHGPIGTPDIENSVDAICQKARMAFGAPIWELR